MADRMIEVPIVIGTLVVVVFGFFPNLLMPMMQAASIPMLTRDRRRLASIVSPASGTGYAPCRSEDETLPAAKERDPEIGRRT